ncbi:spermidine synthase [Thalassotalea piscium]|uniref:Spermidine synthase n=1 Tax=Thalassotalea piscium TaxID=1230533 RepID=A0A7X0TUM9_9GAMM|nr:fused MFS/spermidine synthase [Thalassotalea piscium]MBB6544319.1 spermidine synthase [Thalassotalea piscium]
MNKFAVLIFALIYPLSLLSAAEVIHQERSMYRNILVEDSDNVRCLKFNEQTNETHQSCLYKNDPQRLVFNYTKLLFSGLLVLDKAPERVLIIGLGGGTMSNSIHQLYPNAIIENIEIDPAVLKVARQYFGFIENERISSKVADGRIYIKRAAIKNQQYDWIILDAFNGDYIPEHLLSQEFLKECKDLLTSGGILTSNTFSVSKLYDHESATYKSVFGDFFNVRNGKNSNRVILTSNQPLPNGKVIANRAKALASRLEPFGVDLIKMTSAITSTKDEQDWPESTKVLTDQFSPANLLNQ